MGRRCSFNGVLILFFVALFVSIAQGKHQELIKPPEDGKALEKGTTKGEKGILATMILIYTKTRNAVRYAYDEIQYWKNMKKSFDALKNWFERNKQLVHQIPVKAKLIFTGKESAFKKLEAAEQMFDLIEEVGIRGPREFDHLLSKVETNWDTIASHQNKLMRRFNMLTPSTDQVADGLQRFFVSRGWVDSSSLTDMTASERARLLADLERERNQMEDLDTVMPEVQMQRVCELVSSSVLSKSEVYYAWAVNAVENADSVAAKFKRSGVSGVNATEVEIAWYGIETFQANSYRLRHGLEELKTYNALLGYDVWDLSLDRGEQQSNQMRMDDYHMSLRTLIRKEDEKHKKLYGTDRPRYKG